jgi:hypothetical protein
MAVVYYIGTAAFSLIPAMFWAVSLPFYFGADSSSDSGEAGLGIGLALVLTLAWLLLAGFFGAGVSIVTGKHTARHFGFAVLGAALTLLVANISLSVFLDVMSSQPPPPPPQID